VRKTSALRRYQPGVNFSTAATNLSIATPVSPTNFTLCFWLFPTTLSASWCLCSIDNGTDFVIIQENGTNTINIWVDGTASASAATLAANVWRFIAMTANGTSSIVYTRTVQGSFTTASVAAVTASPFASSTLYINKDNAGDAGLIGTYAGIKAFRHGMVQSEIIRESQQLAPVAKDCAAYLPMRWSPPRAAYDEVSGKTWASSGTLAKSFPSLPLPVPEIVRSGSRNWLYVNTSGGVARAMATTILGDAAVTGNLIVARAMVDAIAGQATIVDSLNVARALADSVSGQATVVDALKVVRALTEAILGQVTVSDALTVARHMVEAMAGQATMVDATNVARSLADAISGQAHMVDAASVARALTDSIGGSSVLVDALAVHRALTETVEGQAFMIAALAGVAVALALAIAARGSTIDALSVLRSLQEAIEGQASISDSAQVARSMALVVHAAASIAQQVAIARAFGLQVSSHAIVAAALTSKLPPTVFPVPFPQGIMLPFTI